MWMVVLTAGLFAAPTATWAASKDKPTFGPAVERQAKAIEKQLVAPCCFKGTLEDHPSPVADKMRQEVRSLLSSGKSRAQILAHYKKQYGQAVLAEPPQSGFSGFVLYGIPFGLAALVLLGLTILLVRRASKERDEDEDQIPRDYTLPERIERRIDDLVEGRDPA